VTVLVIPPPVTVIVPVLAVVTLLASKLAVRVPAPVPLAGVTVSQVASSETVQLVLLATVKDVLPAVLATDWLAGSRVR
jgi:hypothetical protein